jgi:predicted dehydrogenase
MRFALLGDHPDGMDMARALAESGRHELLVYSGSPLGAQHLERWNLRPRRVGDLEEVLADPVLDAILVAGSPGDRPAQLRRALQSEHHVLCVHPADQTADLAYEAAMLQGDTGLVLFPLLPEALHPGVQTLAEWIRSQPGPLQLLEWQRWSSEQVLLETETPGQKPSFPGWDVLRRLGGDIVEVTALAGPEEVEPDEPILLGGRFQHGGLFQTTLLPLQAEAYWRLVVVTAEGRAELVFPHGWPGPARLSWSDEEGSPRTSAWEAWNPWPALVDAFEEAVDANTLARFGTGPTAAPRLTWRDEVRSLELDDAARRSIQRRRSSTLEFQEATEEAGFKGTMTLVGCGLLWSSVVLLILSVWVPWLGWLILPVFGFFLVLQVLRWIVPETGTRKQESGIRNQQSPFSELGSEPGPTAAAPDPRISARKPEA